MRSARRWKTHPSTRTAFESLEPRAMLAGLGLDSFSVLGSGSAVVLPGVSGTNLSGDSPTPGSSGNSASTISSSGSSGTQSTGLALSSNSGSGTGSSSTGSSGSSNAGGLALSSGSGSGAGSSSSGTGSNSDPNSPVLSSRYTGGSNAGRQGTGTNNGGTSSGSDLWFFYGAGLGAGASSSGATDGSSSNLLALFSQYKDGASDGGQGNDAGGTLSNADLWIFYGAGAGAGTSSGSTNGSLANDPAISAQYTGGSGIGRITPLVYNPQSDGPPVFVSGVWTGNEGDVQFVQAAGQGGGQSLWAAGSAFGRSVGMSIYSIGQSYYGVGQYITGNTANANDTWNSAYNNGPIGQAEQIGPGRLAWTQGGLYVAAGSMVAAGGAAAWTTAGWPTFSVGLNTTTEWHAFFGVTANGKINLLHYAEGMGVTGAPSFLAAEASLLVTGLPIFYPNFAINSTAGSNCVNAAFYAYAQGLAGGLSLIPPWAWPVIP